jgi:hypothetical protein
VSRVPVRLLEGVVVGRGRLGARERHGDAASGAREGKVGPDARAGPLHVDAAGHVGRGRRVTGGAAACAVSVRSALRIASAPAACEPASLRACVPACRSNEARRGLDHRIPPNGCGMALDVCKRAPAVHMPCVLSRPAPWLPAAAMIGCHRPQQPARHTHFTVGIQYNKAQEDAIP